MARKHYWRFLLVLLCSVCFTSCCLQPEFISMEPNRVEQGETVSLRLNAKCTFFEPPVEIIFFPPDGIVVSDITVLSATVLEFSIDVSEDALIGWRNMNVINNDGNLALATGNVLEILPSDF